MVKVLYIKNMVCGRCIKVLKDEIEAQEIVLEEIELSRIELNIQNDDGLNKLKKIIENNGFELIDSVEDKLTEQVKIKLIKIVDNLPLDLNEKLSTHLAEKMLQDYSKVSKVFSSIEGITIEKYFIKSKIEKIKELIQAQEKNFTEISQLFDYSHINHLSRQFKAETGLSLSENKAEHQNPRNALDKIVSI
jgi:AraC-like DNA-binding protein/copper chaperone CopZ